ncbi:50S ribosomal protein L35 isoform 1 [Theobroma cacao]|uniref:50S ribosomal protein L35 n=1 Tax=Theobroma cacao TaxID=3641 RepID=A0A061GNR5_THECC|nr:50S ribosomal protein L35 isoform 1 [Theobroma cacao]
MASSLNLTTMSFNLPFCHSYHSSSTRLSRDSLQLPQFNKLGKALKLSSTQNISGFPSFVSYKLCTITPAPQRLQSLTVFAAKGYKMKTHKASAKRFRVTGRGKIVRRRAGKQHLLAKKNTKRKLRLSKMHAVSRNDYDNVIEPSLRHHTNKYYMHQMPIPWMVDALGFKKKA